MSSVAAIVAAAGLSRRMGSCKQLLELGGRTVLARCLDTLLAGGVREVVVVVGLNSGPVAAEAERFPVKVVVNSDPGGDMASSVRVGRAALAKTATAVIVALCDYPLLLPATVTSLNHAHAREPERIVIPCHGDRRGHPLLFPRLILEELSDGLTLRDLVRSDPTRLRCIPVDDPGILLDMDTPEDYRRLCDAFAKTVPRQERGPEGQATETGAAATAG